MKKTYMQPTTLAVELGINRNLMLTGSNGNGEKLVEDGGKGDGTDIGAKIISDKSVWNNEW